MHYHKLMDDKIPPQSIILQIKEHLETHIKLAKLKAIDKGTSVIAGLCIEIIVFFALLSALLFASITLGFFLAGIFHSYWEGFGCVAGFYFLILIGLLAFRKSLERPIINALIKKIL